MKIFLTFLMLCFAFPAFAQETAKPPADIKERTALALAFQKIHPLRPQIDRQLDALAENLPDDEQAKYKADIRKVFNYKSVEDASVKAMAETFTPAEIKATIAYYTDPAGQSAAAKMGDYQMKFTPAMKTALDAALVDLKYPKN